MKPFFKPSSYARKIRRELRRLLCRLAGIEDWHATPIEQRPYALAVVKYLNSRDYPSNHRVAEIGCGLGEILRSVHWSLRDGFDADKRVIQSARTISFVRRDQGITFEVAAFPEISLVDRYDAIVMVNWIHHIADDVLISRIKDFIEVNMTENGEIIIDTVGDPAYRYNHDIAKLTASLPMTYSSLGKFDRCREVFVLRRSNVASSGSKSCQ